MKIAPLFTAFGLAASLVLSGCGNQAGSTPEALTAEETGTSFQKAFAKAAPDLKAAADRLAAALAASDFAAAYAQVTALLSRPDLTEQQRQLLARSQVTVMEKLREKADAGDRESGQVLQLHRSAK